MEVIRRINELEDEIFGAEALYDQLLRIKKRRPIPNAKAMQLIDSQLGLMDKRIQIAKKEKTALAEMYRPTFQMMDRDARYEPIIQRPLVRFFELNEIQCAADGIGHQLLAGNLEPRTVQSS